MIEVIKLISWKISMVFIPCQIVHHITNNAVLTKPFSHYSLIGICVVQWQSKELGRSSGLIILCDINYRVGNCHSEIWEFIIGLLKYSLLMGFSLLAWSLSLYPNMGIEIQMRQRALLRNGIHFQWFRSIINSQKVSF